MTETCLNYVSRIEFAESLHSVHFHLFAVSIKAFQWISIDCTVVKLANLGRILFDVFHLS